MFLGRRESRNVGLARAWAAVDALAPKGVHVLLQRNSRAGYRARTWVASTLSSEDYHSRKRFACISQTHATPLAALEELRALLLEAREDAVA